MTKRVAVALSGGIDSAVTAALLLEKGYEVIGLTGKMTCSDDFDLVCQNAKSVADKLGIEHYIVDVSDYFSKEVIKYFEESYISGRTPNPCIMCNKNIKWGVLFDYAIDALGVDYIATGHYAKINEVNNGFRLYPASDEHKDQLYFLFLLDQEMLAKTLFPLSDYKKDEVKKYAEKYDLPPKSAKESQDICFIKAPITTKKYLNNIFTPKKGDFIDVSSGKKLGVHNGYWQYTIGQRKGIGIAAPEPLYVVKIDSKNNSVYVGSQEYLYKDELILNNIFWSSMPSDIVFNAKVKIRYNMQAVLAKITIDKDRVVISFKEPVSAITPGQACVIYDLHEGFLLGGGFID